MATYTQRFRDSDQEFVARGTDHDLLPVFMIVDGEEERVPHMTFPACLKFMPYAEPIGDLVIDG